MFPLKIVIFHSYVNLPEGTLDAFAPWCCQLSWICTPSQWMTMALAPPKERSQLLCSLSNCGKKKENTHPVYMPSHENLGSHRFPIWIWITKNNPWSTTKVYAQATASSVAAGPRMVGPAPGEGEKIWEKKTNGKMADGLEDGDDDKILWI